MKLLQKAPRQLDTGVLVEALYKILKPPKRYRSFSSDMKGNEPNWNREPAEPNRQLGAEVAQNGFAQIVDGSRFFTSRASWVRGTHKGAYTESLFKGLHFLQFRGPQTTLPCSSGPLPRAAPVGVPFSQAAGPKLRSLEPEACEKGAPTRAAGEGPPHAGEYTIREFWGLKLAKKVLRRVQLGGVK